jgi:hypothetical protein
MWAHGKIKNNKKAEENEFSCFFLFAKTWA